MVCGTRVFERIAQGLSICEHQISTNVFTSRHDNFEKKMFKFTWIGVHRIILAAHVMFSMKLKLLTDCEFTLSQGKLQQIAV